MFPQRLGLETTPVPAWFARCAEITNAHAQNEMTRLLYKVRFPSLRLRRNARPLRAYQAHQQRHRPDEPVGPSYAAPVVLANLQVWPEGRFVKPR
jgi:hypothetical protein